MSSCSPAFTRVAMAWTGRNAVLPDPAPIVCPDSAAAAMRSATASLASRLEISKRLKASNSTREYMLRAYSEGPDSWFR